jgi:hypothetical protein
VLASVITFHSSAVLKDDFDVVLEHLLEVGPEARALITLETTARPLSMANLVIMFRGHARLQPGGKPGVNTVSREAPELHRYLSFARSAATLDKDPRFGFQWDFFLRALSDQTLPLVNPRPAVFVVQPAFGPGPAAMPVGRALPLEDPAPPLANLDGAADVVDNFLAAWEHHHNLAIRDGRNVFALDEVPVARVEWPAAVAPAAASCQSVMPAPPLQAEAPAPVALPGAMLAPAPVPAVPVCGAVPLAGPGFAFMPAALAPRVLLPPLPPVVPAVVPAPVVEPAPARLVPPVGFALLPQQDPAAQAHLAYLQQQVAELNQRLQDQQQQVFYARQQLNAQRLQQQQFAARQNPQPALDGFNQLGVHQQDASFNVFGQNAGQNVGSQLGGPALFNGMAPNTFGLPDFAYFPPTSSMNAAHAAQLGKFGTIAGASNTWTRRTADSFQLKVQAYPRGNADGDSKPRSRIFDIPYASNVISEQYPFITDEPAQLIQRENILECFLGNSRAWAQYILPLVGGDPRRMPVFNGSLKDVLANIHHLALGFGTQECIVLRVCHLISVQNIASCLTPGDAHTLLHPLDISSNYFQGALTKMISEQARNRGHQGQQQQGVRRQLPVDGDAPARQGGGGRQRPNNAPAPPPAQGNRVGGGPLQNNDVAQPPPGCCRRFWFGEACTYTQQNGQPCRYRHYCRTCQAVVPPAETAAHLRSHIA